MFAGLLMSNVLFKTLRHKYPSYYDSLGKPEVQIAGQRSILTNPELRKAQTFMLALTCKGTPKDFPQDKNLRKLMSGLRLTHITFFCMFAAFITLAISR